MTHDAFIMNLRDYKRKRRYDLQLNNSYCYFVVSLLVFLFALSHALNIGMLAIKSIIFSLPIFAITWILVALGSYMSDTYSSVTRIKNIIVFIVCLTSFCCIILVYTISTFLMYELLLFQLIATISMVHWLYFYLNEYTLCKSQTHV